MEFSLMEGRTTRKHTSLTGKQKKYRRDNDLCMYCGDPEHKVAECDKSPTKRRTVTDITIPKTPLSPKLIPQPTGATPKKMDETSKVVGLLALSRELRNKIYEELLYLDEFQVQQFRPWRKLDPKILGVSRQIHHEASEILYIKNGWVTITAVDWILRSLTYDIVKLRSGFPGDSQPITRHENDRLSRSAILDIRMQQDSATAMEMVSVVIPLAVMPRFCRLLTQSSWVNTLELVLQFNHRAKESDQSRLLGYLGQARGLRQVVVTGAEPPWGAINTGLLMTHPYSGFVEILNTVLAYQNSSANESKHGRTLAARNLIQDGADFADWWLDNIRSRMEPTDDDEMDKLLEARADMGFSCASLDLRLGSTDLAQLAIEDVLERLSSNERLRKIHKACAHYYMAQSFEAVGWKNAALYSYLQALRIRPGYRDADLAVDQMERDLGSGSALEDAKIKHNIRNVLEPFRYQPTPSAVASRRSYRTIFQKFDGTAAEIRSVDRDTNGETDLIYMDPNYQEHSLEDEEDSNAW